METRVFLPSITIRVILRKQAIIFFKEDAKNFLAKYPCILFSALTLFLLPAYLSETLFTSCKTLFFMRLTQTPLKFVRLPLFQILPFHARETVGSQFVVFCNFLCCKMPKKKTGARKKAEKQKERQRGIREGRDRPITEYFCNVIMVGLCPSC